MSGRLGSMDPNSQNQLWSKWVIEVIAGSIRRPTFLQVKESAATFARLEVGSAAAMFVEEFRVDGKPKYVIQLRVEGKPVHDPSYRAHMLSIWTTWAERGFGPDTRCRIVEAKLEAGSRQDGSPRDQLILFDPTTAPRLPAEFVRRLQRRLPPTVKWRRRDR
jgi:hypothetical protein